MMPGLAGSLTPERGARDAKWIIENFKTRYLNTKGLISRTFPVSAHTIFDNFDDLAPFFLYYRESDFLLEQMTRWGPHPCEDLLAVDNLDVETGGLLVVAIGDFNGMTWSGRRGTAGAPSTIEP